jgi:hypothetical protein
LLQLNQELDKHIPRLTSVFLSYRHENDAHSQRVRALALRLRAAGLNVVLDALMNEEKWNKGGPPDGWLVWSYAQVEANEKVLIVATPSYSLVYDNKAPAGMGVGAAIEARRIFLRIAEKKGFNDNCRVVILNAGDEVGLPDQIKDYHQFKPNEGPNDFDDLITWLKGAACAAASTCVMPAIATTPAPSPTFPASIVMIDRQGFVNCAGAFTTFEKMLTQDSVERILLLLGYGNQGKSTLLTNLYHHCRSLLGGRSIARVEFKKGGPNPEDHVRAIARALGVNAPSVGNIDERVHALLDACRSRPTIIFFDAYEHAELHHRHWVNLVLERTLDDSQLRCTVAGRELPPACSQLWGKLAVQVECDALKDKDAIVQHALANGFKGKPEEVKACVNLFIRLREREIKAGNHNHSISSQALLEELNNICKQGGSLT